MKARVYREKKVRVPIYPKDVLNQTFIFDDNDDIRMKRVDNKRDDNIRYEVPIIFNGCGRGLYLTKRALDDLLVATNINAGVVKTVRYCGKSGECKGTHWLFSIVENLGTQQTSTKQEAPKNISDFMR